MPTVTTGGTKLQYELNGAAHRSAVAFVPDAGFGPWMWGWQAPALAGANRTVVYAARGTDGSDARGPYTVDRLAADLEAVLADAGVRRAHVVGAGLGGMVATRYAREYGRARSLTLFGTAASGEAVDADALSALFPEPAEPSTLRESLSLAFSERFLAGSSVVDDLVVWRRAEDATGDALAGHLEALRGFDAGPGYELGLPALVCHGVGDPVVPPSAGEALAADLPRGRFEPIEGRRLCFVEHSAAVTDAVEAFVDEVESSGSSTR